MRRRRRTRIFGTRRGRAGRRARPGRGEAGGAVSLWVLLMVPISAFAAVAAMAGPQRLAANFSTQEAANDMATFTVAMRDLHGEPTGRLPSMPMQCEERSTADQKKLDVWLEELALGTLDPDDLRQLLIDSKMITPELLPAPTSTPPATPTPTPSPPATPPPTPDPAKRLREHIKSFDDQLAACTMMYEALVGDLGNLGLDMNSLRGAYSDSLYKGQGTGPVPPQHQCSNGTSATQEECDTAGATWFPVPVLCRTGQQDVVVRDAVHVVLGSRWQDAGWAAAQVWPDGLPMAAESVGRLNQRMIPTDLPLCANHLAVHDEQGRPVWAGDPPSYDSRDLVQSVPRTTLAG